MEEQAKLAAFKAKAKRLERWRSKNMIEL